jgi:hypothetical protein
MCSSFKLCASLLGMTYLCTNRRKYTWGATSRSFGQDILQVLCNFSRVNNSYAIRTEENWCKTPFILKLGTCWRVVTDSRSVRGGTGRKKSWSESSTCGDAENNLCPSQNQIQATHFITWVISPPQSIVTVPKLISHASRFLKTFQ